MTNNHAQILRTILSITFRVLLVIVTIALLLVLGLSMVMNMIFNGPSPAARDLLTMTLLEPSATKWIPALFMGEELVEQIRADAENTDVLDDVSSGSQVIINNSSINGNSDEWANYPDGIRIETIQGDTYTAHVMIIRDPSTVYLSTSSDNYSIDIPGNRITKQIEIENAIAAINAGAFCMIAGLVIVPVVSLFTKSPDKEHLNYVFSCYERTVEVKVTDSIGEEVHS